jgi:signal peptidase I
VSDDNDENVSKPWHSKGDKDDKPDEKRSFLRELAVIIGIVLVVSWIGQTFIFRQYVVPSESMESTLVGCAGCSNDRIVIDKLAYRFGDPTPGDVVVFKAPSESWDSGGPPRDSSTLRGKFLNVLSWFGYAPPNEYSLVKRVIATGGQTVECHASENVGIKVDGKPLHEPYIDRELQSRVPDAGPCLGPDFGPIKVPEGNYWVMGDNRTYSADSRFHTEDEFHGTVPKSDIRGKVRFVIWPAARIGGVGSENPQK